MDAGSSFDRAAASAVTVGVEICIRLMLLLLFWVLLTPARRGGRRRRLALSAPVMEMESRVG